MLRFALAAAVLPLGLRFAFGQSSSVPFEKILASTKTIKRFTQAGGGDLDGSSWTNAMPLSWLSKSLALADPNSAFLLGIDLDREKPATFGRDRQIFIKTSGTPEAPIILLAGKPAGDLETVSPDSKAVSPLFSGTPAWTIETFGKQKGPPCFIAVGGSASHLMLGGFSFSNTSGDGFIKFRAGKDKPATFDSVHIAGLTGTSIGRAIETDRGATLTNLLVEDCTATGVVRGFGRFRQISKATFRHLIIDADHMDAGVKNACQLIAIESGDDILFEDIVLKNAISTKKDSYVQGDGIVCERKTRNITLRRCQGTGMGDAAFDLKTTDVTMENCSTDDCKFGARIWTQGNNVIRDCSFTKPTTRGSTSGACVQASGTLEITNTKFQAGKGTSAIALHMLDKNKPPHVRIKGGSIQLDDTAALATTNGIATLELQDVLVNGEKRTQVYQLDHNLVR